MVAGMVADAAQQIHSWWAPALAFAAGVVSFASPCVLPLVPGYLAFVTGQAPGPGGRRSIWPILGFIAGFTVVFTVLFGFTASLFGRWIHSPAGQKVAGAVVIAFGVFMLLYALRLGMPWLYREERPLLGRMSRVKPGPAWAFPLGMAFAAGWSPCIGPVLGAIYTLAGSQGSTARAVILLFAYSLGLGLPFLLIGLGIERAMNTMKWFARNYQWFAGISGVLLIAIGVLLVTGWWERVLAPLLQWVNRYTPPI
jgi:cytochrome c-type biogenesis protein